MTPKPRRPRSLFESNCRRLEEILGRPLPELESSIVDRLRAENFMELVLEILPQDWDTGAMVLPLYHYFEQRGGLCPHDFAPDDGEALKESSG